jgi:cysteine desulfuration protein SufE
MTTGSESWRSSALPPRLAAMVEHYAAIADRSERIQALIDLADAFRGVPASVAGRPFPESHRVPACESEVYVFAVPRADGRLDLHFAVENPQGLAAKALAALLTKTLSGLPAEQLTELPTELVFAVFGPELSLGKGLGLTGMVSMVAASARRALSERAASGAPGSAGR